MPHADSRPKLLSGMLRYVDLETGSQMPLVTGHAVPITSLALPVMEVSMLEPNLAALDPAQAPAVQMMATTAEDGVLRIWQLPTEQSDWHQVCLAHHPSPQSSFLQPRY